MNNRSAFRILLVWVILLSILYSLLAILRHEHFQSGAFDLGLYDQAVWQYSRLEFPYNTIKERFILGDHFTLTLPLISPLYYLWDDVKILLIFQATFIAFSTLGVYKISKIRKLSPVVSLVVGFIYSLFYGIQTAVSFDFHPIVIAAGMLVWVAYLFESKNWKIFWPVLILFLLTQENTGIALSGLGLIYLFHKEYRKTSIAFILGGFAVSFLEVKLISFMSPTGYQYVPYISKNPIQILSEYFNSPEKIDNWKFSLVPVMFLPLLSPGSMLAVLLDLSQYYITGETLSRMWTPYQHHRAILAPFLSIGFIEALVFLRSKKFNINYVILSVLLTTILSQYYFHFPLNKLVKKDYWKYEVWMENNNNLIKLIPKDASIASTQNLVPHLSHRNYIYLVWPRQARKIVDCKNQNCWWLEFTGRPEYLFVDERPDQWVTQILETNSNFRSAIKNMEEDKKIKIVRKIGDARLYKILY